MCIELDFESFLSLSDLPTHIHISFSCHTSPFHTQILSPLCHVPKAIFTLYSAHSYSHCAPSVSNSLLLRPLHLPHLSIVPYMPFKHKVQHRYQSREKKPRKPEPSLLLAQPITPISLQLTVQSRRSAS